jgi:hypothetical protein
MGRKPSVDKFPLNYPEEYRATTDRLRFGLYDKERAASIMARHKDTRANETKDAKEKKYQVLDKLVDRFDCMAYLVAMVSEGVSLVELTKQEGMPTLLEVRHWKKWHPNFAKELMESEMARGDRFFDEANNIALDATNDDNAAIKKLKHEACKSAAAKLNPEYQEKKLVQTEDITDKMSKEQLEDRVRALMQQYPGIRTLSDSLGIEEAEIVTEEPQVEEECQE